MGSQFRVGLFIGLETFPPLGFQSFTIVQGLTEARQGLIRDITIGFKGPANGLFGQFDFIFTKGFAVHGCRALLVRAAASDDGPYRNNRGPCAFFSCQGECIFNGLQVISISHPLSVPAVGIKAGHGVFRKGDVRAALDSDVVVIVEVNELAEFEMAGEGGRFMGHTLHELAVADDCVGMVIDHLVFRTIEMGGQKPLGNGHSHTIGKSLTKGAGSGLDPFCNVRFRVTGGEALPLAEILEFIERKIITSEMQQAVNEHRAVSGRENKPIPVRPIRI